MSKQKFIGFRADDEMVKEIDVLRKLTLLTNGKRQNKSQWVELACIEKIERDKTANHLLAIKPQSGKASVTPIVDKTLNEIQAKKKVKPLTGQEHLEQAGFSKFTPEEIAAMRQKTESKPKKETVNNQRLGAIKA